MALKRVFEPIKIGNIEVPNRIVRTAHGTNFSSGRFIGGADLTAYHVERAKGGVGMTVLEAAAFHPSSAFGVAAIWDKAVIQSHQELMAAVRPYGMRVIQQLWHGGNLYYGEGGSPPWGVSTTPSKTGVVAQPMSEANIQELLDSYVNAALICREGGVDGVEFHASHGYLPYQFLSPMSNRRTDKYGGSLENRMRFLLEALRRIRGAVGRDFVVGMRIGAGHRSNLLEAEVSEVVKTIEGEGLIDYLSVSKGDYYDHQEWVGGMDLPVGHQLPSAAQITAVSRVPRIVVFRFRTLEEVEQVLNDGTADMVSMVRALIADPLLVNKTREGKVDEVRPCIACNQGCIGGLFRVGRMGCVVNPAVGFEQSLSEDLITKAPHPKRVLVIGGGPAGMEAARIASLCGHSVKLVEASPHLGGSINVAKRAPRFHGIGDITYWQESELKRLGVELQLNTYVEADDVRAERPDVVFIATGSVPRSDGFQAMAPLEPINGFDLPHVKTSVDILTAPEDALPRSAVVFDDLGSFEAIAVAARLIEHGTAVTFVTSQHTFGGHFVTSTLRDPGILERLYAGPGDFKVVTRAALRSITHGTCDFGPLQSHKSETVSAEQVVLVTHNEPLRTLYDELHGQFPNIHLIGDARSPRDLQAAIAEGHLIARSV